MSEEFRLQKKKEEEDKLAKMDEKGKAKYLEKLVRPPPSNH